MNGEIRAALNFFDKIFSSWPDKMNLISQDVVAEAEKSLIINGK